MIAQLIVGMNSGRPNTEDVQCSWIKIGNLEFRERDGHLEVTASDGQVLVVQPITSNKIGLNVVSFDESMLNPKGAK